MIINKKQLRLINSFGWEIWLKRDFPIFVPYQMVMGATKKAFSSQKINGDYPFLLFQNGAWYECKKMHKQGDQQAQKYFRHTNISIATKKCEMLYKRAKNTINQLLKDRATPPIELFKQVVTATAPINVYVWIAHTGELYLKKIIERKIGSRMSAKEKETFIADLSFPSKKNAHILMAEDIKKGLPLKQLHKKYAWMKARRQGGFGVGYTLKEVQELKKDADQILEKSILPKATIPNYLKDIAKELKDLTYLRAFRTDALFELYYLAQPIFHKLEKELNIDSVGNHLPSNLISKNLKGYGKNFCIIKHYDDIFVSENNLIKTKDQANKDIKGQIAWKGKTIGTAKILLQPKELNKVKKGDILVTNMTIPAYLPAMRRASAFVTDEGGITCHASILAREMGKPCIIGTKNATKVLKDGDLIEVDANIGIVTKMN